MIARGMAAIGVGLLSGPKLGEATTTRPLTLRYTIVRER